MNIYLNIYWFQLRKLRKITHLQEQMKIEEQNESVSSKEKRKMVSFCLKLKPSWYSLIIISAFLWKKNTIISCVKNKYLPTALIGKGGYVFGTLVGCLVHYQNVLVLGLKIYFLTNFDRISLKDSSCSTDDRARVSLKGLTLLLKSKNKVLGTVLMNFIGCWSEEGRCLMEFTDCRVMIQLHWLWGVLIKLITCEFLA